MTELRDRWARNNDPERPTTYIRPLLTLIFGILFWGGATSVLAVVFGVLLTVVGLLELAMLLARVWMRRRTGS